MRQHRAKHGGMVFVRHDAREQHGLAVRKHVRQRISERLGALRIVTAVDDHRRFTRHVRQHLETAGPARGGDAALDSRLRDVPAAALQRKNRFQGQCGVLRLIAAQQRGFVGFALVGERADDQRFAGFDLPGIEMANGRDVQFTEIGLRDRAARRVRHRFHGLDGFGFLRPRHHGASRLDDAGLLRGDLADGVAEQVGMIEADARDDGNIGGRDDVGGVKATAKTDFQSEFNGNVAVDVLEQRPEMVILWAGYAFSKDYSTPRGHMHAIEDITATLRTGAPATDADGPQPSTCWTCKSPDVPRMMEAIGVDAFYNNKWGALGGEIVNPIGCADCHEPENMNLHISRPALIEAFERQGKDITEATPQEMRSLVCAQCHVEYYFKGDGKYLTFPWDKGFTVEDMEAYYDEAGFYDYIHKLSRTPILKAQHPDFEIARMGIHGQRGVSCADCHMPYKSEGGVKFSDHHIQSPLAMIDRTCQTCHRESEETLRNNVYERQRKANEIRNRLEQELAKAHIEAKFAWDKGATETQMKDVLALIRQAQWRWDFGVASHGGSFHAPQEIQRILSHGLDRAMQARLAVSKVLAKNGYTGDVPMPDISTKAKAQEYIGLDMDAERAAKEKFLKTTVPRERTMRQQVKSE